MWSKYAIFLEVNTEYNSFEVNSQNWETICI